MLSCGNAEKLCVNEDIYKCSKKYRCGNCGNCE